MERIMVRQTSIESYIEELPRIETMQDQVYNVLKEMGEGTDHEIAKMLGFDDPNKVRPRRFELAEQGRVVEKCRRECKVTGKQAIVWEIMSPRIDSPAKQESHGLTHIQFRNMKKRLDKANAYQLKHLMMYIEQLKRRVDVGLD